MNTLQAELASLHAPVNNILDENNIIDETPNNESIGITVTVTNCLLQSVTVTMNPTESTQTITLQIQPSNRNQ